MLRFFITCLILLVGIVQVLAAGPNVVVSIAPIHALVANVMAGIGTPYLVVRGGASPHSYALRPSEARMLANANIVFWIGPHLEQFLSGPLNNIATNATAIALDSAPNIIILESREAGGHEGHDEPPGHEEHDEDPHIWLDPENAKLMTTEIVRALITADPQNASIYTSNATRLLEKLDILIDEIGMLLEPVQHKPYVVFHDAYQYFEQRFSLNLVGAITINPETPVGVRRIDEIHTMINEFGAVCIFSEPQFTPRLAEAITRQTGTNSGVLDPLGASQQIGPQLYFDLIRTMANEILRCLQD